jgi:hypothetical protein
MLSYKETRAFSYGFSLRSDPRQHNGFHPSLWHFIGFQSTDLRFIHSINHTYILQHFFTEYGVVCFDKWPSNNSPGFGFW